MATLNFPTNPSLNQLYSFGGKTWIWNGSGWQLSASGAINGIVIGNVIPEFGGFTNISATGNITGSYFIGNGSQLTGIVVEAGSQIVNANSNVRIGGPNSNVTVSVNSVANVAVFTTTGVSLTGTVTANNFVGNGAALTSVMADRGSDSNNWNTLTQMGVYTVNRVSWSGTVGTPLDSQVFIGLLQVTNSTDTAISQVFYPGTVDMQNANIQWNRSYWSGSWTSWIKIVNDFQVVVGGEF
jgi:hypothetical protein